VASAIVYIARAGAARARERGTYLGGSAATHVVTWKSLKGATSTQAMVAATPRKSPPRRRALRSAEAHPGNAAGASLARLRRDAHDAALMQAPDTHSSAAAALNREKTNQLQEHDGAGLARARRGRNALIPPRERDVLSSNRMRAVDPRLRLGRPTRLGRLSASWFRATEFLVGYTNLPGAMVHRAFPTVVHSLHESADVSRNATER